MTRRQRRDKHTVNSSVISGLRLEADAAERLCAAAREGARVQRKGDTVKGDVAQMARFYVRTGLGYSADTSNLYEETEKKQATLCGLKIEREVFARLKIAANRTTGGNVAAMARHLIRVGLGFDPHGSLTREDRNAALALELQRVRTAAFKEGA